MRCRHFTIRLTPESAQKDESRLNEFLQQVHVHSVQSSAPAPDFWSVLVFYGETGAVAEPVAKPAPGKVKATALADEGPALTAEEQQIYQRLREWRSRRAATEGKPPYIIATNAVLLTIAQQHMSIRVADDLARISQFGATRSARYGSDILQLLYLAPTGDEASLFDDER